MAATDPGVQNLIMFVLAIIVGYYVISDVPAAVQTLFVAVSAAILSVLVVGALIAAGTADVSLSMVIGFLAVSLAAINIGIGFSITQRMLSLFRSRN